ncbi:MAG TPA: hypothetical protein EYO73_10310 [Sulfurimonas sp.]|nr:hypothetical protein [Sulfurimonas sp.]
MQLKSNNNVVSVRGNISSIGDFESIENALTTACENHKNIILIIYDSLVINSSLIGHLVKLVNQDGVNLSLQTGSEILFELLDDLGLSEILKVKRL